MKRLLFAALAYLALGPRILREKLTREESFREVDCGAWDKAEELYSIRLEAGKGLRKQLTFNNATDGGSLTFTSTTLRHLKWASNLSNFDELAFDQTEGGFGMLSIERKDSEQRFEFGIVSKTCWDGLRRHVDGLVQTRNTS